MTVKAVYFTSVISGHFLLTFAISALCSGCLKFLMIDWLIFEQIRQNCEDRWRTLCIVWTEEEVWDCRGRLGWTPVCLLCVEQGVRWTTTGYVPHVASLSAESPGPAVRAEAAAGARPVGRPSPREVHLQWECRFLVSWCTSCIADCGRSWNVDAGWKWQKDTECTASV